MILRCQKCGAAHSIPSTKLAELGGSMTCRRCNAGIPIETNLEDTSAHTSPVTGGGEVPGEGLAAGLTLEVEYEEDNEILLSPSPSNLPSLATTLATPTDLPAPVPSSSKNLSLHAVGRADREPEDLPLPVAVAQVKERNKNLSQDPPEGSPSAQLEAFDKSDGIDAALAEENSPISAPKLKGVSSVQLAALTNSSSESEESKVPPYDGGHGTVPRIQQGWLLDPPLEPTTATRELSPTASLWPLAVGAFFASLGLAGGLLVAVFGRIVPPSPLAPTSLSDGSGQRRGPENHKTVRSSFSSMTEAPVVFLARNVRLRDRIGGRLGTRLEEGEQVRRIFSHDGWVLILGDAGGPVGFVEADALQPFKPVSALAHEVAFVGCEGPRETCIVNARRQHFRCMEACAEANEAVSRCEAACRVAFEKCQDGCRAHPSAP